MEKKSEDLREREREREWAGRSEMIPGSKAVIGSLATCVRNIFIVLTNLRFTRH